MKNATRLRPDLHVHTTRSDGTLAPPQVVREAARQGVTVLALCDHDVLPLTFAARAALAREAGGGVRVLPAMELSCGDSGRTHLLAYGVPPDDPALRDAVAQRRADRLTRAEEIVRRLNALLPSGVAPITLAELEADAGWAGDAAERTASSGADAANPTAANPADAERVIGRPHAARALIRRGVCGSVGEAFDRYLSEGRAGFVPTRHPPLTETTRRIAAAGAVAVLAHPAELTIGDELLPALLDALCASGLRGVEVYHPSAAPHQRARYARLARERGLLVTGGSDFHSPPTRVGCMLDAWRDAEQDAQALLSALRYE